MDFEITLTYALTKDDLVGAWRQHFRHKVLRSKYTVIGVAVLGICFTGIVLMAWCCVDGFPVGTVAVVLAVSPGLGALNYFVAGPLSARRSNLCGKTVDIRITEDGVSWRGGEISSDSKWSRFREIGEGKVYILLYLSEFHYFPLLISAFASQADLAAFREFVANRQSVAAQMPPIIDDAGEIPQNATAADEEIILRFRLTEAEQVSVLRGKVAQGITSSKPILALHALFGILAASAIFMMLTDRVKLEYFVLLAPGLAVASGLAGFFLFRVRRWARSNPVSSCDRLVAVNDRGLQIDNGVSRSHIAWAYVSGFRKSGDLVVLDLGPHEYITLAKRGFASPEAEKRFYDIVAAHIPRTSVRN